MRGARREGLGRLWKEADTGTPNSKSSSSLPVKEGKNVLGRENSKRNTEDVNCGLGAEKVYEARL